METFLISEYKVIIVMSMKQTLMIPYILLKTKLLMNPSQPVQGQLYTSGKPITLDVNLYNGYSNNIPLCLLFNARSIYNKCESLNEMLQQIGPDACIISETFERETKRISSILKSKHFESLSQVRKKNLV